MLHDSIKLSTEELIGAVVLEYLATLGVIAKSRRPGGAGEPDVVCVDADGGEFGIEITAGHYSAAVPQDRHGLARE